MKWKMTTWTLVQSMVTKKGIRTLRRKIFLLKNQMSQTNQTILVLKTVLMTQIQILVLRRTKTILRTILVLKIHQVIPMTKTMKTRTTIF